MERLQRLLWPGRPHSPPHRDHPHHLGALLLARRAGPRPRRRIQRHLLGLTHYLYHRSTISIDPVCYLQDLFTTESARGRGVATALIQAVYREAQRAHASRVYWQTHETNETAQRLYDKLAERSGFIVYRHIL